MHNQLSSGFMGNPMQGLRPLVGSPQVGGSNLSAASGLKLEQQGMSGLAMQVRKTLLVALTILWKQNAVV